MQEARALGITPRGLQWADADGSGTLDIRELLRVLKQVTFRKRHHMHCTPQEAEHAYALTNAYFPLRLQLIVQISFPNR